MSWQSVNPFSGNNMHKIGNKNNKNKEKPTKTPPPHPEKTT